MTAPRRTPGSPGAGGPRSEHARCPPARPARMRPRNPDIPGDSSHGPPGLALSPWETEGDPSLLAPPTRPRPRPGRRRFAGPGRRPGPSPRIMRWRSIAGWGALLWWPPLVLRSSMGFRTGPGCHPRPGRAVSFARLQRDPATSWGSRALLSSGPSFPANPSPACLAGARQISELLTCSRNLRRTRLWPSVVRIIRATSRALPLGGGGRQLVRRRRARPRGRRARAGAPHSVSRPQPEAHRVPAWPPRWARAAVAARHRLDPGLPIAMIAVGSGLKSAAVCPREARGPGRPTLETPVPRRGPRPGFCHGPA